MSYRGKGVRSTLIGCPVTLPAERPDDAIPRPDGTLQLWCYPAYVLLHIYTKRHAEMIWVLGAPIGMVNRM